MLRRKLPSGAPEWAALPKPLLAIIMRVAVNSSSARAESYRALQLVCKSWREAFLDYSADLETVAVRLFYATELYDVCKLLPGIIHLEATRMIGPQSIYLHPLSACSRLTSLKFTMEESGNGTPFFDMLALPSRLKNLEIENVMVDADCCRYLRCTDLTSLTFLPYENLEISNPFTLLQHLPKLEVSLFSCPVIADASINDRCMSCYLDKIASQEVTVILTDRAAVSGTTCGAGIQL